MNEAIEKSNAGATTVTKQSEKCPYEIPSIIICPEPGYKQTLLKQYNMTPAKLLYGRFEKEVLYNHSVQELFEKFTYANDFYFTFSNEWNHPDHILLNPGLNKIPRADNETALIEIKTIPTLYLGVCHLLQYKTSGSRSLEDFSGEKGEVTVGYNKPLNPLDIPRHFRVYFTPINEWHSVIFDAWLRHKQPFEFVTSTKTFSSLAWIYPLYREYYHLLLSKTEVPNQNMNLSLETCIKPIDVLEIRSKRNCTEKCIPFIYSSLFNTSEIRVCKSFVDHSCAFMELGNHIQKQLSYCMKPTVEKYFRGRVNFRSGKDYIDYLKTFNEDKKKSTLMIIFWMYHNQLTTVVKEKLVYDSKDLLAWLGGALGIFIGYSFYDFAKHIIDIAFYCAYRKMNSH